MSSRLVLAFAVAAAVTTPAIAADPDDPTVRNRKRSAWVARLKADDAKARADAVQILGEMRWFAGPGGPALAKVLADDPDEMVRRAAAESLAKIADPAVAVPALVAALKDTADLVRFATARGLAEYGPKAADAAVPVLATRLKDKSEWEVLSAATALARIEPAKDAGVRALLSLIKDSKDDEVRDFAFSALLLEIDPAILTRHAALIVPVLSATLKAKPAPGEDRSWSRRAAALDGLAAFGPVAKSEADTVAAALTDRQQFVRLRAVRALHRIDLKNAAALPALVAELKVIDPLYPDRFNLMEPVNLAAEFGPAAKDAVPELVAILQAGDKVHVQLGQAAISALGRIGPAAKAALPVLVPELKVNDRKRLFDAAWAVSRIDPANADAVKILKGFVFEPDASDWIDQRMLALDALVGIAGERAAALQTALAALREPGRFEKRNGLQLGPIAHRRNDTHVFVQGHCARLLGAHGAGVKEAMPALVAALTDPDLGVRVAAAEALEKLDPAALRKALAK